MRPNHRAARDLSRLALLAAVRPDARAFRALVDAPGTIDWSWLLGRAAFHKVAPLVAARVESCGLEPRLEAGVAARFRRIRHQAAERTAAARHTLRALDERFGREHIPFLVIKGSMLAERFYGEPTWRSFVDVDIVVQPGDVTRAEAVLRSWDYRLGQVGRLLGVDIATEVERRAAEALTKRFYERFEYEIPLVAAAGDARLPIDVHWHIAPPSRLKISAAQLWEQTRSVVVADATLRTLTPEATVIHLAIHATTCAFAGFRLLHLCDVPWALERFDGSYERLWALADAWRVSRQLDTVVETVERVLGVPTPPGLRAVRPRRPRYGALFHLAATPAFLVDTGPGTDRSRLRRAWAEVVWSVAMRCLLRNLTRSLRVRVSRLRWRAGSWWRRLTAGT